jgi:predicted Holliday junction resolvase-like endonuclease
MKNGKAILGVVLVFVLGVLAGGLITHRFYMRRIRAVLSGQPVVSTATIVRDLNRQLQLTPEQRDKLQPVINETRQRLQQVREQIEPQALGVFDDAVKRVREILTPEQREKFDKIVADRKASWPKLLPSAPPATMPTPLRQPAGAANASASGWRKSQKN